jgi:hypothetical protein
MHPNIKILESFGLFNNFNGLKTISIVDFWLFGLWEVILIFLVYYLTSFSLVLTLIVVIRIFQFKNE